MICWKAVCRLLKVTIGGSENCCACIYKCSSYVPTTSGQLLGFSPLKKAPPPSSPAGLGGLRESLLGSNAPPPPVPLPVSLSPVSDMLLLVDDMPVCVCVCGGLNLFLGVSVRVGGT